MREPLLEPILRRLRINKVKPHIAPGSSLLDIGCGQGILLRQIKNLIKHGVGLDQKAKGFLEDNLEIRSCRLRDHLPFNSNSFDVVTMLAVLEHLELPETILKETWRVLKPGGKIVLTVPSNRAKPVLEFLALLGLLERQGIKSHKKYYDKESLKQNLEGAGFFVKRLKSFELGFNLLALATKPNQRWSMVSSGF